MTAATPPPALSLRTPTRTPTPVVRCAREADAPELAALSEPFVRSGALRERPASLYAAHATDFLVAESPEGSFGSFGGLGGCVGLRVYPGAERGFAGVLYNFCVAEHMQGRGVGAELLRAALAMARAGALDALFTATTGGGDLFLRYGFAPASAQSAPPSWAASLDPRRNARVLARNV
ncbi:GNAT family N-acetyltransferase [Streptomyces sp. NPDC059009]|uniref:GNAT family N-acetyltransferase n=1 Tax=Streptomyces sp. NPDC059009 TaxID=3346694 RepID=UPI0036A89D0E